MKSMGDKMAVEKKITLYTAIPNKFNNKKTAKALVRKFHKKRWLFDFVRALGWEGIYIYKNKVLVINDDSRDAFTKYGYTTFHKHSIICITPIHD